MDSHLLQSFFLQVLVDLVLWMYPFMAYASGMSGVLIVLGTGLLTIGYQGLVCTKLLIGFQLGYIGLFSHPFSTVSISSTSVRLSEAIFGPV